MIESLFLLCVALGLGVAIGLWAGELVRRRDRDRVEKLWDAAMAERKAAAEFRSKAYRVLDLGISHHMESRAEVASSDARLQEALDRLTEAQALVAEWGREGGIQDS